MTALLFGRHIPLNGFPASEHIGSATSDARMHAIYILIMSQSSTDTQVSEA